MALSNTNTWGQTKSGKIFAEENAIMPNNVNPNSPFFHEERHASLAACSDRQITICGAGALGGNLAEMLARMGFTRIKLIDRDRVDMRNLSTQPYSRAEVGTPKARALANT